MDVGLKGKHALVLSSSRGLGHADMAPAARRAGQIIKTADAIDTIDRARAAQYAACLATGSRQADVR